MAQTVIEKIVQSHAVGLPAYASAAAAGFDEIGNVLDGAQVVFSDDPVNFDIGHTETLTNGLALDLFLGFTKMAGNGFF